MILILLAIGAILIVAAIRGTQGQLAAALGEDVPAYVVWAAALLAVGALGFAPPLRPASRLLLGLVLLVIVLNNYQSILAGFADAASGTGTPEASPAGQAPPGGTRPPASSGGAAVTHAAHSSIVSTLADAAASFGSAAFTDAAQAAILGA
jgi:hypothetical protein